MSADKKSAKLGPRMPRARSQDEMRGALEALRTGEKIARIAPNYDSPEIIMEDVIDELLSTRQIRADVQAFIADQQAKLTRR